MTISERALGLLNASVARLAYRLNLRFCCAALLDTTWRFFCRTALGTHRSIFDGLRFDAARRFLDRARLRPAHVVGSSRATCVDWRSLTLFCHGTFAGRYHDDTEIAGRTRRRSVCKHALSFAASSAAQIAGRTLARRTLIPTAAIAAAATGNKFGAAALSDPYPGARPAPRLILDAWLARQLT